MKVKLTVVEGPEEQKGKVFLFEKLPIIIGRNPKYDVPIADAAASRQHCRVERRGDAFWLIDLGSRNKTRTRGLITKEREIRRGDEIQLGKTRIAFWHDAEVSTTIGRYVIREVLADGLMASAYVVEQQILGRKAVLKKLNFKGKVLTDLVYRHAGEMAKLDHPDIGTIYDVGEYEGHAYLVEEYIEGRSLRAMVEGKGGVPVAVLLRVLASVAGALQHAHERGVVYQYIDADGILVRPDGRAVLGYMGLSAVIAGFNEGTAMSIRAGRPTFWASPERVLNRDVTPGADIWALGMLMYELLAGHPLCESARTYFKMLQAEEPMDISGIKDKAPEFVVEIVRKCLEKKPQDRYVSAAELRRTLDVAVEAIERSEDETLELPAPAKGQTLLLHVEYQEADRPGAYREYRIEDHISAGSYGDVFKARDLLLNLDLAIKILKHEWVASPDTVERFRREATLLARLSHPNIVHVHNWGRWGGTFFIVMDLLEGPTVQQVLAGKERMLVGDAISMVTQVAAGVAAVHRAGAVHRDLKPANIKLVGDRYVIFDFGMARVADAAKLTMTGAVPGSPAYMSPEQAMALPVTGASDVYAMGVIFYEAITGWLPHVGGGYDLLKRIAEEPPTPVTKYRKDLPPAVLKPLEAMLAKNPEERPSAQEVHDILASSVTNTPLN